MLETLAWAGGEVGVQHRSLFPYLLRRRRPKTSNHDHFQFYWGLALIFMPY